MAKSTRGQSLSLFIYLFFFKLGLVFLVTCLYIKVRKNSVHLMSRQIFVCAYTICHLFHSVMSTLVFLLCQSAVFTNVLVSTLSPHNIYLLYC